MERRPRGYWSTVPLRGAQRNVWPRHCDGTGCADCRPRIVKEIFLCGAIYFCPKCQPAPR